MSNDFDATHYQLPATFINRFVATWNNQHVRITFCEAVDKDRPRASFLMSVEAADDLIRLLQELKMNHLKADKKK